MIICHWFFDIRDHLTLIIIRTRGDTTYLKCRTTFCRGTAKVILGVRVNICCTQMKNDIFGAPQAFDTQALDKQNFSGGR